MTKVRSRINTKNNTKIKRNIKIEIIGIIVISLGLLSLLSMYNKSTGFIGDTIKKYSMLIAGFGG